MQNIFTIEALANGQYRMLLNGRWGQPQSLESCAVDMRLEERMRAERAKCQGIAAAKRLDEASRDAVDLWALNGFSPTRVARGVSGLPQEAPAKPAKPAKPVDAAKVAAARGLLKELGF